MSQDERLHVLREIVSKLEPPPNEPEMLRAALDAIDVIVAERTEFRQTEARLVDVSEALFRLASLDFSSRTELRGDGSLLDAVAGCINMLAEELRAHLDERIRIEQELEDRVRTRTAELEASSERYKTLIEGTNAVPWEADSRTLAISYISSRATRLLGEPDTALVGGASIWQHIHQDDREAVVEKLSALASGGTDHGDVEYRFVRTDGRVVHIRSTLAARRGRAGDHPTLQGIMFDVTAQKTLERELQHAQKLEAVGRLAAGIAHEINTPVQFVSDSLHFVSDGVVDLAAMIEKYRELTRAAIAGEECVRTAQSVVAAEDAADLGYLLENLPRALSRSLDGLDRITVIVRSMKDFAHPDQKEMTQVDLNRGIESTLVIAKGEYKYVADIETDLGEIPHVTCHGGDVNQAILNIVVNAAHAIASFSKGSGKGLIKIRTKQDGDDVVITIADTGGGIREEIRDRIYDPFFTTKEVGKGTGQGLSIARTILEERHGGELSFESQVGVGTTFSIRLPIDGERPKAGSSASLPLDLALP